VNLTMWQKLVLSLVWKFISKTLYVAWCFSKKMVDFQN